jgi:hypothetical protein
MGGPVASSRIHGEQRSFGWLPPLLAFFFNGGRGAHGVGALGAVAARSADAYGNESLVSHRCRQCGCDRCMCAARPRTATAADTVDRRTRRGGHRRWRAIILPFQPTFAAILAIGGGAADRLSVLRDVRMSHMPRLAGILPPQWSGIRLKTATLSSLALTTVDRVHGSLGEDEARPTAPRDG